MGNKRSKIIAYLIILCMTISMIALPSVSYADTIVPTNAESALSKVVEYYYKNNKDYQLESWWDLMAIYSSQEDLTQFLLPEASETAALPTDYAGIIFTQLMKGQDASNAATNLKNLQDPITGRFSVYANQQAYAMIALDAYNRNNSEPVVYSTESAINALLSLKLSDGAYGYSEQWGSDIDTTGIVAVALAPYININTAASLEKENILNYLNNNQNSTGGFGYYGEDNANSIACAIWAYFALGENPLSHIKNGKTPLDALLTFQLESGGFSGYTGAVDDFATKQAAIALADLVNGSSTFLTLETSLNRYSYSTFVQFETGTEIKTRGYITFIEGQTTLADAAQIVWKKSGYEGNINLSDYQLFKNNSASISTSDTNVNKGEQIRIVPANITRLADFTSKTALVNIGVPVTLKLMERSVGGTEATPISGASITINGSTYGGSWPYLTDSNGEITITSFNEVGTYIISSAAGTDQNGNTISRPYCIITVTSKAPYSKTVSIRIEGIKKEASVVPYSYQSKFTATSDGTKIITAAEVLKQYSDYIGWTSPEITGSLLNKINNFPQIGTDPEDYWMWGLNGSSAFYSIVDYAVEDGDSLVFYYGGYAQYPTLSAINVGAPEGSQEYATLTFQAYGWSGVEKVVGASVTWNGKTYVTNEQGVVTIPAIEIQAGKQSLQLDKYAGSGVPDLVRFAPDFKICLSSEVNLSSGSTTIITSADIPKTYTANAANPGIFSIAGETQISGNTTIATLPGLAVYAEQGSGKAPIEMNIVSGTKISVDSTTWNGVIQLPKVESTGSVSIPNSVANMVVSVGSSTESFTFDKPVRLVLPGTAGQRVGFIKNGSITEITNTLNFDDYNTAVNALTDSTKAAKIISGNDTIIWTRHFTNFVAYLTSGDPDPNDGTTPAEGVVYLSIDGINGSKYMKKTAFNFPSESGRTALSILTNNVPSAVVNSSTYGSYVSSIFGLSEFDEGELSGWLYKVNNRYPGYTADTYTLKANDYVQWVYTKDLGKDVGGNVEGVSAVEGGTTTVIEATMDSSGKATATIAKKDFSALVTDKVNSLKIKSDIATLTFDQNAIKTISEGGTGDIKITAAKLDTSKLSDAEKKQIGNRPVYEFTVTNGSKTISDFHGRVSVSIPYTPASGEDPSALIIYYLDSNGKLEMVKDCKYDSTAGTVVFSTNHFSKYVIGYQEVSFQDVNGHWSETNIRYLSARGIINGKAENKFMPNDSITRAEFVTILGNKLGVDFSKYSQSSFSDVRPADWFAGAVAWASGNGIVTGSDGKFRPNDRINRQEMAVVLDRYMTDIEKRSMPQETKTSVFYDQNKIASYAKASVSKMQQLGIINGKTSTSFAPDDYATRGEAAKMITIMIKTGI